MEQIAIGTLVVFAIIIAILLYERNIANGKKEVKEEKNELSQIVSDWKDEKYLFDFKMGYRSGFSNSMPTVAGAMGVSLGDSITPSSGEDLSDKKEEVVKKIAVTPKQVLGELEVIPTPFSLELLDEKISVLKDKEAMIKQEYSKREIGALIERLENRKKYPEFKSYFDNFQNTNEEKMDVFIAKHKFVMKTSDIFIPEFPDDAIKTMKEYTEQVEKLCGKKPVYYVIAEEKDFKKAYEKRDPILLAQSPFGFFYQILGSWDIEMILLGEL